MIDKNYKDYKKRYKDKYRLVHVDNKDYEYVIEFYMKRNNVWARLFIIYNRKYNLMDHIFQNFMTYQEYAKKEFINQMMTINKEENKKIV